MDNQNWEIYFNALKKQDWKTTKTALQNILQVERENPQILLKLGDIHQRTGDSINAIASYHQAALLLQSRGFLQKAIALYKIILRLDPFDSAAITRSKKLMMEIETAKFSQKPVTVSELPAVGSIEDFKAHLEKRNSESIIPELFSEMPEEEVLHILQELPLKSFSGNEKVVEEGDSGDSMYIIRSGKAKVIAHLFGKEIELAILEPGDIFGEVAFLTGRPRTASVIAEGPLDVYEISRLELEGIIDKNPSLLQKIEDFYESRVQDTIKKAIP